MLCVLCVCYGNRLPCEFCHLRCTRFSQRMNKSSRLLHYNICKCQGGVSNNLGIDLKVVFVYCQTDHPLLLKYLNMSTVNYVDYIIKTWHRFKTHFTVGLHAAKYILCIIVGFSLCRQSTNYKYCVYVTPRPCKEVCMFSRHVSFHKYRFMWRKVLSLIFVSVDTRGPLCFILDRKSVV